MSQAEQLQFWQSFVQVAPVIMIALVFEARVISKFVSSIQHVLSVVERLMLVSWVGVPLGALSVCEMYAITAVGGGHLYLGMQVFAVYSAVAAVTVFAIICMVDILGRAVPEVLVRVLSPGVFPLVRKTFEEFRLRYRIRWIRRVARRNLRALAVTTEQRMDAERFLRSAAIRERYSDSMITEMRRRYEVNSAEDAEIEALLEQVLIDRARLFDMIANDQQLKSMRVARVREQRATRLRDGIERIFV